MPEKRKYNEVSLGDRLKAVESLRNGTSARQLAKDYSVAPTTVLNWAKDYDNLRQRAASNENLEARRASRVTGPSAEIDRRVYDWFCDARARAVPISGPILQSKAKLIAENLGLPQFAASNGWLESFRVRHNIAFRVLSGESAAMDSAVVRNWMEAVLDHTAGYELRDIWNIDETGLFWRGLANKVLL